MIQIQGTVDKIYENDVNTKFGPKKSYNLVVEGNKYSGGFKKPACNMGDVIQFSYTENGQYMNMVKDSIQVVQAAPPQAVGTAPPSNKGKDGKKSRTPDQIMRTSAIELIASLKTEDTAAMDLIEGAIIVYEYIKNGEESELLAQLSIQATSGDPLDGE